MTVEVHTPYVDDGATAFDTYDGNLTGSIVTLNPVDVDVLDDYTVSYNVQDSNGNSADEVTRTVHVVDTTAPVIDAHGDELAEATTAAGASVSYSNPSATDNYDASVTVDCAPVTDSTFALGDTTVTCSAVDSNGNNAIDTNFTVTVVDTTAPTIDNVADIVEEATSGAGAFVTITPPTSHDDVDGDLASSCDYASGTFPLGVTTVTCSKTDAALNVAVPEMFNVTIVDTTGPIITLLGPDPQTIEVGSAYSELGATASDDVDGDISGDIVIDSSNVDTNTVGSYVVTYDVNDSEGNSALQVTRTVDVVDTTLPIITLLGDNPQTFEVGTAYSEFGATALDNYDGNITSSIVIDALDVDTNTVGSYEVRYDVADSEGNDAVQVTRTVNVIDTGMPFITLLGTTPVTIEVFTPYVDDGATAFDAYDGNLTDQIVTVDNVDQNVVGNYTVTYDVTDSSNNDAIQVTRTVHVVDTTNPIINLSGITPVTIEVHTAYVDDGATATDNYDASVTVITTGTVDSDTVGDYTLHYNAMDSNGNNADEVTRLIHVVDTTAPVIGAHGDEEAEATSPSGAPVVYSSPSATDNYDVSVTVTCVQPSGTTFALGYSTVECSAADSNGNNAINTTFVVHVVDTTGPVITLVGSNPQTIQVGNAYSELGATALDNYDGDLTGSIVIDSSSVDTNTVGSYSVTYDVADSHGNNASQVTRTVNVVDTDGPVITLLGTDPVTIEVHTPYVDSGATAFDSYDGNLTANIVTVNPVNEDVVGEYTVTYDVNDSNGNAAAQVTRTVNVVDTTNPVISLLGNSSVTIEVMSSYTDDGATALDNYDGDLTPNITVVNPVDENTEGDYTVTYNVQDSNGNNADEVTRAVHVINSTVPPPHVVISDEASESVGNDSATITWTTNVPATSRVVYDTSSHSLGSAPNYNYAFSTVEDSSMVTDHSVLVSGLTPGLTYYYRVISHASPEVVSDEFNFTTLVNDPETDFCTDSDGGIDIWTPGIVNTNIHGFEADDCDGASENLKEFYCEDDKRKLDNIKCSDYGATCITVGNKSVADYCACPDGQSFNGTMCVEQTFPVCGDGVVNQQSEECDGTAGVGEHQSCSQTCELIDLPYCGDEVQNNDEQCDGSDGVGAHQSCSQTCELVNLPYCGDTIKNGDEQCDQTDGVGENQSCSETCTLIDLTFCGDNIKNGNEECDGSDGVGEHQSCTQSCQLQTLPFCGDNVKNGNEQCDGTDGVEEHQTCTQTCELEMLPYCGDNLVNQQSEQCDDGNFLDHDGCSRTCQIEETEVPEFGVFGFAMILLVAGLFVTMRRKKI